MFVHIWRMRARKKKVEAYEKFGRQMTLAALKKIDGCQQAHFIKVFEAHKPEYLWLVFWRDQKAFEAARANPVWREQIKQFEAGQFYKTIPLELVCKCLGSFGASLAPKPRKISKPVRPVKAAKPAKAEARPSEAEKPRPAGPTDSAPEGQ